MFGITKAKKGDKRLLELPMASKSVSDSEGTVTFVYMEEVELEGCITSWGTTYSKKR